MAVAATAQTPTSRLQRIPSDEAMAAMNRKAVVGCRGLIDPRRNLQQSPHRDQQRQPSKVGKDRHLARADRAEREQHGGKEAGGGRRQLGRDRHEHRQRGSIENGLQPSRSLRGRLTAEHQRIESAVRCESVEKENVAIRPPAIEHHRRRRQMLPFMEHLHEGVGVIVCQEHGHEDDDGCNQGCPPAGCRLSVVGCRVLLAQDKCTGRAGDRQGDDDEVVESLRILRHRHRADAAGWDGEPVNAIRGDREDQHCTEQCAERLEIPETLARPLTPHPSPATAVRD